MKINLTIGIITNLIATAIAAIFIYALKVGNDKLIQLSAQEYGPYIRFTYSFLSACVLLLLLLFIYGRWRVIVVYPRIKWHFSVSDCSLCYRVNEKGVKFIKTKKLKALQNKVDYYVDHFFWTGSGDPQKNMKLSNRSHDLTFEKQKTLWKKYHIGFGKHLEKGEEEETEVTWTLPSDGVPFFSITVDEPTDKLTFKFIPLKNSVETVIFEEKSSIAAKKPFKTIPISPDNVGEYVHTIKPKLYYYYEMRWTRTEEHEE